MQYTIHLECRRSDERFEVVAGTVNRKEPGEKKKVVKVIQHEKFTQADTQYDIALLKV